ncbi:hydroxypyruvate reductase [Nilaparvata lugens]|uniref:hydroxypyruvate reductase n=1 Tax=Nilaparvata lugens TaxID=108931 RepID=UPI00193E7F61|nr:hydroxypyruvate reductase [Nilaparvata lugens]
MALNLNRVLISDAVDSSCVTLLQSHGVTVDCKYKLPKDQLIKEIKNYDGLIVRSDTKVTADVLEAATSLKVVGRAGTGVDNIDIDAATKKGVIVLNTPGGNSISACELTCSLIMCLARNVAAGCQSLKEGRWDRKLYTGSEISGKTLAVIGLGRIGREVATRMQAFGMRTIGFDPILSAEKAKEFNVELLTLDEIWPQADYVTVHTPLIPQTRNLINDAVFAKCKKGMKVINVARGGIIEEAALLKALNNGACGGAGLDVFSEEPPKSAVTLEIIGHPRVVCTPHLGASTDEAQTRVAVEVAEQFVALKDPQSQFQLTGIVNAPILAASLDAANVPWIELAKNLGKIAAKMLVNEDFTKVQIYVNTTGAVLESKKFVGAAALMGMLTGRTKNGLNLINAAALAADAGLFSIVSHASNQGDSNTVTLAINVGQAHHSVQGTVQGDGNSYLTSIDGAQFTPGVAITSSLLLFQGSNAGSDFAKIIGELSSKGLTVSHISVAVGKQVYFAVQTSGDNNEAVSTIPGVRHF